MDKHAEFTYIRNGGHCRERCSSEGVVLNRLCRNRLNKEYSSAKSRCQIHLILVLSVWGCIVMLTLSEDFTSLPLTTGPFGKTVKRAFTYI